MKLLALVILLSTFSSLALTEVVNSFQTCSEFFFPIQRGPITPTVFTGDQYKKICQRWNNKYRFATLYDTERRIPVYSAYTFLNQVPTKRSDDWKIEPQLEDIRSSPEMMNSPRTPGNIMHQAVNSDYTGSGFTRGHVFPRLFAGDQDQADSSFTLTNIAPQRNDSNQQWEQQVETPMRKEINNSCQLDQNHRAYIVTGVVPGNNWQPITRDRVYERGINVPSHYWSAYCCKSRANVNNLIGRGYIARQGIFNLQITNTTTPNTTIQDLNGNLTNLYGKNFSVFPGLDVKNIKPPVQPEILD